MINLPSLPFGTKAKNISVDLARFSAARRSASGMRASPKKGLERRKGRWISQSRTLDDDAQALFTSLEPVKFSIEAKTWNTLSVTRPGSKAKRNPGMPIPDPKNHRRRFVGPRRARGPSLQASRRRYQRHRGRSCHFWRRCSKASERGTGRVPRCRSRRGLRASEPGGRRDAASAFTDAGPTGGAV